MVPESPWFLDGVIDCAGLVAADRLARALGIAKTGLAIATGLKYDAMSATTKEYRANQARLRDLAEIVDRVLPWAGSAPLAFIWYRAQPLPSFGDRTAEDLVKEGRAESVKVYLSRIAVGGYA